MLSDAAPRAVAYLAELIDNPNVSDRIRLQAAIVILDRAYGKPVQAVDAEVSNAQVVTVRFEGELEEWSR